MEIQILRAGQLVILAVPGEFTTMAGRRLREAVYDQVHGPLTLIICFRRVRVRRRACADLWPRYGAQGLHVALAGSRSRVQA